MNIGVAIVVILLMALVFTAGGFFLRFKVYGDLQELLHSDSVDTVLARLDGRLARSVLSPYAAERLRFQALARKGDVKSMAAQFNNLMKLKLNEVQRAEILSDGFNAFAGLGDSKHVRRILNEMETGGFSDLRLAAYRRHFDVVLAGAGAKHRKQLENIYATLSGARRGYVAYLLSKIYAPFDAARSFEKAEEAARLLDLPASELDARVRVNVTL